MGILIHKIYLAQREQDVGFDIILDFGPSAPEVFLIQSVTLTLLRGGAIRVFKSGGLANSPRR